MQTGIGISPVFEGTLSVKFYKGLKGKKTDYTRAILYPTSPEQDYDMIILSGKASEANPNQKSNSMTALFNYINKQELKDPVSQEILKLATNGDGYKTSIAGTHIVVRKDSQKIGDANINLFSEILT